MYYLFNGQRVMMHDGASTYLHADHLGSTTLLTNGSGAKVNSQSYFAFCDKRLTTDRQYTGQQKDGTGLYYHNSRVQSVRPNGK